MRATVCAPAQRECESQCQYLSRKRLQTRETLIKNRSGKKYSDATGNKRKLNDLAATSQGQEVWRREARLRENEAAQTEGRCSQPLLMLVVQTLIKKRNPIQETVNDKINNVVRCGSYG